MLLICVPCHCYLALGDPLISSWYTQQSGQYARVFEDKESMLAGESVVTWNRGQGIQNQPVYAGVQEIAHSPEWLYIKTSGLGFHTMGPWYFDEAKTQAFANFPANTASIYRFPRKVVIPQDKSPTSAGVIGYFVDGIAMFDSTDTFSYDTSQGVDQTPVSTANGDGVWNRDAYINEGVTFDNANAHQAGSLHHYHANPPALRHALQDSVQFDGGSNAYTEKFNGNHSPIIGWVRDGLPIYGPYGFDDPKPGSDDRKVRRMVSGYQLRDGSNGSTDLTQTGRKSLPKWVEHLDGRSTTITSAEFGPTVDARIDGEVYILGRYFEDYTYKGDLGLTLGTDFDLNEYNVRFTRTPEYPEGTWAYFTCIHENGTPTFPYNIATRFFGQPEGEGITEYPEPVTIAFTGGPDASEGNRSIAWEDDVVVMTWSVVEGGTYRIDTSNDLKAWDELSQQPYLADQTSWVMLYSRSELDRKRFFKINRISLEDYDDTEFGSSNNAGGPGGGGLPPGPRPPRP